MKLLLTLMLYALPPASYAQVMNLLESLESHQKEIKSSDPTSSSPEVKIEPVVKTKTAGTCTASTQTSLPLRYITSLFLEKDGKLAIRHDPRSGKLTVSSPNMISNCNNMIEWVAETRVEDDRRIYALEARIKKGANCSHDNKSCDYSFAKVENKQFKEWATEKFEPTMSGFENCLQKAGIFKDNKVVEGAIYPDKINEQFLGYKETGELQFISNGPSSKLVKAKYDDFISSDGCKHYEKISPEGMTLLSLEDAERERILAEKEEVMKCNDLDRIADFRERHKEFAGEIDEIIQKLMIPMAEQSGKAIASGKFTEEDLKVLKNFQRLVVEPMVEKSSEVYERSLEQDGEELEATKKELDQIKGTLANYAKPPFLSPDVVNQLETNGLFDDAIEVNYNRALLVNHAQLGNKVNGVVVTPEVAAGNALQMKVNYDKQAEIKRERFEIATGQRTGPSNYYFALRDRLNQNIQVRTQNYMQEISSEYNRMQPGGHCYRPFRNVQRCLMNSQERINELQAYLNHYNKVDAERIKEYEAKGKDYAELERQGRRYLAQQNGEEVVESDLPMDNTLVPPGGESGIYSFDYNGGEQQMNPQQMNNYNWNSFQQPNPFQQYQQQQLPQQNSYWGNPYQAYRNYNLYGSLNYGW